MIVIAIFIMLALDFLWLFLNKASYGKLVQNVQHSKLEMNIWGAIVAYACVIVGLVFIIIPAAKQDKSKSILNKSIRYGALFGFVVYAIFNATNYAIFKNYSISTAIKDTLWGTTVFCIGTYVALS